MKPDQFFKRFGTDVLADEFQWSSTAWHYGGAWIIYTVDDDGRKNVVTQSMDPMYCVWWVNRLRELQETSLDEATDQG
jgi:hypothetical protein